MRTTFVGLVAMLMLIGGTAFGRAGWVPPDGTITAVSGTRSNGFHVDYYHQRDAWLPTLSEALAECGEYDRRIRQVRCAVHVRTWYRDLGDTKRAIRFSHGQPD
jgi:hypothetical protein